MLDRLDYNAVAGQLLELGKSSQFSQMGNLLRDQSISERGFLMGTTIEKIGGIFNGLVEAQIISTVGRVKVQTMVVSLAEQCINEQMEIQKRIVDVESKHQDVALKLAAIVGENANYINQQHTKMLEMIAKIFDIEDQEMFKLKIGILTKLNDEFRETMNLQSETIKEISKDHAVDPEFVIKCSEHTANIITQCLNTVVALGAQNQSELESTSNKVFSSLKKIVNRGQQPTIEKEKEKESLKAIKISSHSDGAQASVVAASSDISSIPSSNKIKEANELYAKGKTAFDYQTSLMEAGSNFGQAKSAYKNLLKAGIFSSSQEKEKAQKRFDKLETGKYSKAEIAKQFGK